MKNIFLKILAIIAAIAFWIIVVSLENTFYVFPEQLEIQAFNLPEDLTLKDPLGKAVITLQSAPRDIQKLSSNDFEVYIDLKNAAGGEIAAEVSVTSKNPDVRVLKIEPSKVQVELEEVKEKTLPINYDINGEAAENYQVKEVKLSRDDMIVKGSKEGLAKASELRATVVLKGTETTNLTQKATLQAVTADGTIVEGLNFEQEDVNAEIIIEQGLRTKVVGIQPVVTGELQSAWLKNLTVRPSTIQIRGSNERLSRITNLKTLPVSITTLQQNKTAFINVVLPEGITLAEGEKRAVSIIADIEEIATPPTISTEPPATPIIPPQDFLKPEEPDPKPAGEAVEEN